MRLIPSSFGPHSHGRFVVAQTRAGSLRSIRFVLVVVVWILAAVLGLALLAEPATTGAQQPSERARAAALFRQGLAAFDSGDYQIAYDHFSASYQLRAVGPTLFNLALTERALLRFGDALEHLQTLLQRPRELDAAARRAARREMEDLRAHVCELSLDLTPADAEVLVDRVPQARRPLVLQAGRHVIEVRRRGHRSMRRELTLVAGTMTRETFRLVRLREQSRLALRSDPSGADVRIDATRDVRTPWRGEIEPGRHVLRFTRPGYAERREVIVLAAGRPRDLHVALSEESALLESPWFWLASGVALVGASILTVVLVTGADGDELRGNFDPPVIESLRQR